MVCHSPFLKNHSKTFPLDDSHSNSPANRNPVMRSFESSKDMYSPSPKKSTLLQTGNSVLSPYNYGNVLTPTQDNYAGYKEIQMISFI